jgi:demethoxyubiquinone hydroxylase (CLK1/Coq7/Cat5 family)
MNGSHEHFEGAARAQGVDRLESFCRGEMSAVQTYAKAISSPSLRQVSDILQSCHASHEERAAALADRILEMGGRVPESMGVWRSLLPLLEGAAAAISAKMAVTVLEEGEDRLLKDYREHLSRLDLQTRSFVNQQVLPAQIRTHQAISSLKHSMT